MCCFAGDVAHQVSPFGARGANSGIQDTDNLCWKLKLVIDGKAPGQPARQLLRGAHLRRRRKPDELDALYRLHHAQEQDLADLSQRRAELARNTNLPGRWSIRGAFRCQLTDRVAPQYAGR
jgi:2-polyprenyl-6-methoxyphenol hydroxylase-like FAD-dependent oxidoreductase